MIHHQPVLRRNAAPGAGQLTEHPLTLAETAERVGRGEDWFYRHWRRLVAEARFPLPIHDERPFVWWPSHVQAWIDRRLAPDLAARVAELEGREAPARDAPVIEAHSAELRRLFAHRPA
jgi:predicted DNA-binding transcriptional regulator AlpA